jgi:hypothetical protein
LLCDGVKTDLLDMGKGGRPELQRYAMLSFRNGLVGLPRGMRGERESGGEARKQFRRVAPMPPPKKVSPTLRVIPVLRFIAALCFSPALCVLVRSTNPRCSQKGAEEDETNDDDRPQWLVNPEPDSKSKARAYKKEQARLKQQKTEDDKARIRAHNQRLKQVR